MTTADVFRRVIAALEAAGIPYMLTGSFASSYHGAPRATQDVDMVIVAGREELRALIRQLSPGDFYADERAALEAHDFHGQFNLIDLATGWKIDLIVRKDRPFSREEFERRVVVDYDGVPVSIATPEDVVIAKLEWAQMGASRRQTEDAARLLRVRWADLDRTYIAKWVHALGLGERWKAALNAAAVSED
ncbi:MAG TPA: hypothetical protein VFQ45_01200 [Longimicrobium sp.]|nr:hypothetical protein [Longimicrobium sp.]